jgi:type II secretory ATPase GspE/PulE/Tfp pilus assembly ATPase PilB-like protein
MAAALRATLRQDPNIIMLDSIEDRDTLTLALSAVARGMLVIASTEAQDAAAARQKLRALGGSDKDLGALRAVVSTAQVAKLCDKQTRDHRPLERRHLESLEGEADFAKVLAALKEEELIPKDRAWKDLEWARVTGCSECNGGYRGVTGLFEVSVGEGAPLNLIEDALFKAAAGVTSVTEVLRFAEGRTRA